MPATVPVPTKSPGDVLTSALWNTYVAGNINKLLNQAHRVLTVAQFGALSGIEDGDEVYLEVDATNGVIWHLRYVNAEPTYKWRFLGGPALHTEIATTETVASTSYTDLATAGPSVALPRGGDYDVDFGHEGVKSDGSNAVTGIMSYAIGGSAASDTDAVTSKQGIAATGINSNPQAVMRVRRKTGLTAVSLVSKYKVDIGTGGFRNRWLRVVPVRIV